MELAPFALLSAGTIAALSYLQRARVAAAAPPGGGPPYAGPSKAQILLDRASCIGPNCEVNYPKAPLLMVRGAGQHLYDELGAEYLDCVNNVAHVGHSHPRVVAAVAAQMAALQTNSRYLHPHITEYAKRLGALLPGELKVVYWVNSGSEANDLALRLARAFTGRRGVITVDGAYHGHTVQTIDVSPYKYARELRRGERGCVRAVPQPDEYSGVARGAGAGGRYAAFVDRALAEFAADEAAEAAWRARTGAGAASTETLLPTMSKAGAAAAAAVAAPAPAPAPPAEPAEAAAAWAARNTRVDGLTAGCGAFLLESILSCGGQVRPPAGYLRRVHAAVRAAGGLCIADEVQVGFGRVGAPHFWAFQLAGEDVVPDIITLGKPIANGFPCAAVVTTPAIARAFAAQYEYFNTFSGSPVAGAAANAALDVMLEEDLAGNAARVGKVLLDGFHALAARFSGGGSGAGAGGRPVTIGSVRGVGFMVGLEMVKDAASREPDGEVAGLVKYKLLAKRILISTDGEPRGRARPPLRG